MTVALKTRTNKGVAARSFITRIVDGLLGHTWNVDWSSGSDFEVSPHSKANSGIGNAKVVRGFLIA